MNARAVLTLALIGCGAPSPRLLDAGVTSADAHVAEDAGPSCADPPGSACNPIVIDTFPFRHEGNTGVATESDFDAYACAASTSEAGPEVHYELRLPSARRVSFAIEETSGVDVDVHVLRAADASSCIARANTTLDEGLGAGTWRVIVDTFDGPANAGGYALSVDAIEAAPRALGEMWNTFYFLADEDDHTGAQDTPIYDASCSELARVRREFHDSVCIEGSGRLSDGRIINFASNCTDTCASALSCGGRTYSICYSVLDPERYPWGAGAGGRSLAPDRSIAVDPDFVALGTWIFFEELRGLVPPGSSTPHSGCMRAEDVGGGIDGNQFDYFAGTRARWLEWEEQLPTRSTLHAFADDPRCYPTP
jgi:3D (Asp-Asp-Asp) domain-containing protein